MRVRPNLLPPRYRDVEWCASGGMGDVYRAVDDELGRRVAIKVLAPRFAADDRVRLRFRREALAAARLSDDPNTVTTFDVGEWNGTPFIVMELLGGGTLEEVVHAGAQPPGRVLPWVEQAAASLDAAHRRGVVHRDVKPANLFLDDGGRVRVGDFGIATAADLESLTLTGTVLGTAGYLAPEQALARPASGASDGYALAVVAYELLTGSRPFARDSYAAEAHAHVHDPVPPASHRNRALPPAVDAVFAKALAKDPDERFQSSTAFVAALRDSIEVGDAPTRVRTAVEEPVPSTGARHLARHLVGATLALAAVAAAIGAALLVRGHGPETTATTTARTTAAKPVPAKKVPGTKVPGTSTTSAADASDLNTRGYELMLAGNYAAALPLLQRAVAGLHDPADPVTAYANFNLGQTLVRLGRCGEALPYLERAEQLEPERSEPRSAIVYARACAGRPSSTVGFEPHGHGRGHGRGHGKHDK